MRLAPIAVAVALSLTLVGAYVALGGTSYHPAAVADPCRARPPAPGGGRDVALERVVLAAADAAACELGVSREALVLALRDVDELERLAREEGRTREELERALRQGLVRAVDGAEGQGLIGGTTADFLRGAAKRFPLSFLLPILRGGSALFGT